jgi:hypothetical protein
MIKRKGKSQIGNLTPDHKSLENRGQIRSNRGVLYTFGKIFFEGYKIFVSHFQKKIDLRNIWTSKLLGQQKSQFWDSHLEVLRKNDIWM